MYALYIFDKVTEFQKLQVELENKVRKEGFTNEIDKML